MEDKQIQIECNNKYCAYNSTRAIDYVNNLCLMHKDKPKINWILSEHIVGTFCCESFKHDKRSKERRGEERRFIYQRLEGEV